MNESSKNFFWLIRSTLACFPLLIFLHPIAQADQPEIPLGATIPLTGNLATYGNLIRGGIELAAEDLKKEGISTKLYFEDTPLSGAGVISAVNALIQQKKVKGIVGNFSNVAMASMAPILEKAKIPAFHTAAADPSILDSGNFTVTTNVRIRDEARQIADWMFSHEHFTQVAIVSIQTNFGQAYREFFRERFLELGGRITADESFELQNSDYRTLLTKVKVSNPQAVFGACFGHFLGLALRQSRELGMTAPYYSVYESEDSSVLEAASGHAEGLRYFVTTSSTSVPQFADFRKRYLEHFKMEPGTFGSNSYDATMILARALAACKLEAECTLKKVYETKEYPGVSGPLSIEADGATKKRFILREVRGGAFQDVKS